MVTIKRIRVFAALACLGAVTSAHALAVTVFLDNLNPTINQGDTYMMTGTVKIFGNFTLAIETVEAPYLNGDAAKHLSVQTTNDFQIWAVTHSFGGTFSGDLFTITAAPNATPGDYQHSAVDQFAAPLFKLSITPDFLHHADASASYNASVEAVPEPASLLALGFGVTAFIRRRARKDQ